MRSGRGSVIGDGILALNPREVLCPHKRTRTKGGAVSFTAHGAMAVGRHEQLTGDPVLHLPAETTT